MHKNEAEKAVITEEKTKIYDKIVTCTFIRNSKIIKLNPTEKKNY